ncbi:hypothetical protein GCM10022288_14590 [Gryllotalpicola kribbensis]|uniref:Peptidoglycan-binding protein n=1 Tax=Gryllotalpicola kribbensis TaxID=993084 RepID=A0ABP8AQS6_9MICO
MSDFAAKAAKAAQSKAAKAAAIKKRMDGDSGEELVTGLMDSKLGQGMLMQAPGMKPLAKGTDDETAQAVMAGAAQGAMEAGVASGGTAAIGGAIWGGIKGLTKTKRGRAIIAMVCVPILALPMLATVAISQMTSAAASSFFAAQQETQEDAASAQGYTEAQIEAAMNAVDGTDVPWAIALVWQGVTGQQFNDDTAHQLNKAAHKRNDDDLDLDPSDLADLDGDKLVLASAQQGTASKVQAVWVLAMQDVGLSAQQATTVYGQAIAVLLGQSNSCSTSTSAAGTSSVQLNASQQKNAITILGVAKSVVGDTQTGRDAAVIAIATAEQESTLLMYANDGSDTKDIGKAGLTAADLAAAKASMSLPHDAVGHNFDSVGLFQQRPGSGWGSVPNLMTAEFDAAAFLGGPNGPNHGSPAGLLGVTGWQTMSVTDAAQAVQGSNAPDAYAKWSTVAQQIVDALWDSSPAISTGLSSTVQTAGDLNLCGGDSTGAISADQVALAKQIQQYQKQGLVTYWHNPLGDVSGQIDQIANGTASSDCNIHAGVLQVIVFAVQTFGEAQINDLNRTCSGNGTHKGISAHFTGDAVDFGALGSKVLQPDQPLHYMTTVGWDPNSAALIRLLDPYMPQGSEAGQESCRADPMNPGASWASVRPPAGTGPDPVDTKNIKQFDDVCSHEHIDIGVNSDARLNFSGTSA